MANTSSVTFTENDQSFSPGSIPAGITGVSLNMKMGPVGRTDILIRNWQECQRWYGGLTPDRDDALIAKRMLEGGTQLRINNVRHYTDITDTDTLTAVKATINATTGGVHVSQSGTITTGHNYTLSATGYNNATVAFNTTAFQTIKDLIAEFKVQNPGKVGATQVYGTASAPKFTIAPAYGYSLSGLSLSGTGVSGVSVLNLEDFTNTATTAIFTLTPKGPGAEYNKLVVNILPGSNGNSNYFNMEIYLEIDGKVNNREIYENLKVDGPLDANNQTWLSGVQASSFLVDIAYEDLSSQASASPAVALVPYYGSRTFENGSDGGAIVANDYIGDSAAKTGWYAFDQVDDISQLAAPNVEATTVHIAGTTYANNRKDLVYFAHLSNSLTTENALITTRQATNIDSSYTAFFAGGLKVTDPRTGLITNISELGDVLAIAASSEVQFGAGKSFAGPNRGIIQNALGVVNNFGAKGNYTGMNSLANHQINVVVSRDNKLQISGNFTAQIANSLLSFLNCRRLVIHVKKSLTPILERYIEEPNLPATWKKLYLEVTPFFEGLKTSQDIIPLSESYPGWRWEGDQFAKNLDQLVINNKTDVLNRKYKVRLGITPTPSMGEIIIDIDIIGSAISFEESLG